MHSICKTDKSLSHYPSHYLSPSQHGVFQVSKSPSDGCDRCDSSFSFLIPLYFQALIRRQDTYNDHFHITTRSASRFRT